AMARHAVVDLAQIFNVRPRASEPDRLLPDDLMQLRAVLSAAVINLRDGVAANQKLSELRRMYEPYVNALAGYLFMTVPAWVPPAKVVDNWQTSAWGRISTGIVVSPLMESKNDER